MRLSLEFNEGSLARRVLFTESRKFNRRWYTVARVEHVLDEGAAQELVLQQQQQQQAAAGAAKKGAKKETKKEDTSSAAAAAAKQAELQV